MNKTFLVALAAALCPLAASAGEISYTYASWAVRDCPGHWVLRGEPGSGALTWAEGKMRPEDAIFEDFIRALEQRGGARRGSGPAP